MLAISALTPRACLATIAPLPLNAGIFSKENFVNRQQLAVLAALLCLATTAFAQDQDSIAPGGSPPILFRDAPRARRFAPEELLASGTGLPTWQGSFTYKGTTYKYVMVGSDPAKGSKTTTVPVFVIPLKFVYYDGTVFDASTPMVGLTESATQAIQKSPIFDTTVFKAGSVSMGDTQYIDAFQRGNFWNHVSTASPEYHVLLGTPSVLPTQTYKISQANGQVMPGPVPHTKRAILNQGFIDNTITPALFKKFPQLTPGSFTIFLTYNVFPGGNYGFHDVYGSSPATGRTYTYTSYLEPYKQLIDADISTLAHEVAEWVDDPYISNQTPCGTLLEVGDPLSSVIFSVNLNGMTWHPQDLAFIGYFSFQRPAPSVNHWLTFRNTDHQSCQ
jgi:hypothetical protein